MKYKKLLEIIRIGLNNYIRRNFSIKATSSINCILFTLTLILIVIISNFQLIADSQIDNNKHFNSSVDEFIDSNFIIPKTVYWDGGLNNVSDDSTDKAYDVTIDIDGNLLITGLSFHLNYSKLPILKFNSDGILIWNKSIPSIDLIDVGEGITSDSTGSIYLTGYADSYSDDAWLWKFSSDGEMLWNNTFGGDRNQDAEDLALDSQGNIIIVGDTDAYYASYKQQCFICKFDITGQQLWNQTFGFPNWDEAFAVTVDKLDNYYLTGRSMQNNQWDAFIYKFSSKGELLWNRLIEWKEHNSGWGITLSKDEDYLFIAGDAYDSSKNIWYSYISKISTKSGRVKWERTWSGLGFAAANALTLDSNGDLLVVGDTENLTSGNSVDVFLCKYSQKDGKLIWSYIWKGDDLDRCFGVAERHSETEGEHIYLVGETSSFGLSMTDILLLIIDDSDFDSLTDEWEIINGLNPYSADSDNDDLSDYLEVAVYETDPLNPDTDSDGWTDGIEVAWGTNPLNPKSTPKRRKIILSVSLTLPLISGSIATFTIIRKRKSRLRK